MVDDPLCTWVGSWAISCERKSSRCAVERFLSHPPEVEEEKEQDEGEEKERMQDGSYMKVVRSSAE